MCLAADTRTSLRAGMKKLAIEHAGELYNLILKIPLSSTTYLALLLCLTTLCETHYSLSQQKQLQNDLEYGN